MSTDKDSYKSLLDKVFHCVNSGVIWSISQALSACPPKKKKSIDEGDESERTDRSSERTDKSSERTDKSSESAIPETSPEKSPYVAPSQICPSVKPCCIIKMQDPCAPCCCGAKLKPPPCPPGPHPREPREPVCGCDLCQKGGNEKCCDRNRAFRGITLDPRYFEKA